MASRGIAMGFGWNFFEDFSELSIGFGLVDFTRSEAGAVEWVLWSWGPDKEPDTFAISIKQISDPTNGAVSDGNVFRWVRNP